MTKQTAEQTYDDYVAEGDEQDKVIESFSKWMNAQEKVRPYSGYSLLFNATAEQMNRFLSHGQVEPEGVFQDFQNGLNNEAKAQLLFQILGDCGDEDGTLNRHGKALALELAETCGPDYTQLFYRFVVLVTKLA